MSDVLWLLFVALLAGVSGWALCERFAPGSKCTLDDWLECKEAFCYRCKYPPELEACRADLKVLSDRCKSLARSRSALSAVLQKRTYGRV
jgi:hypothetical protein